MNTNSFVMLCENVVWKIHFQFSENVHWTIFFLTGKIKYFNNRKGPFKNEKSVVLHIFFSPHPWPLGDLQNSIVLKENCSRVWCGVWGWLVWLIKALCLEQMEKGKLPCYTGSVFKKEASVGQMGASVFGFAESGVSMRWKVEREKGDAMGWMFVPPSSCVEALTHTHTHTHTHTPQYDEPWR